MVTHTRKSLEYGPLVTRILDYNGQDADRTVTVADIVKLHGSGEQYAQVTASTADEAAACEAAGIEMGVCMCTVFSQCSDGTGITEEIASCVSGRVGGFAQHVVRMGVALGFIVA